MMYKKKITAKPSVKFFLIPDNPVLTHIEFLLRGDLFRLRVWHNSFVQKKMTTKIFAKKHTPPRPANAYS